MNLNSEIILFWEANVHESQSITDYVRGEICFKEIMLNIRLDLYHSPFTHLVCEFLIILQIFFYIYSIYLLFLSIISICVITYN